MKSRYTWEYRNQIQIEALGRSQDFSKGGHTVSNIIVMAFSPRNIVGCLLKKTFTKGGGGGYGHPSTPLATPLKQSGRFGTSMSRLQGLH